MENSNLPPTSGEQPAGGSGNGGSTAVTPAGEVPVGTFGPSNGAGDVGVRFRLKLTIKNGVTLFGGPKAPGSELGSGEGNTGTAASAQDGEKDVVVEVEGDATLNGGAATLFGGPRAGGSDLGGGEQPVKGKARGEYQSAAD